MESKFENKLKRLQDITNEIENSSLSLDESIKLYEEGVNITKELEQALKEAQDKVETIVESKK